MPTSFNRNLMFSRKSDEYSTPPDLFARLDREFHFLLDAAATADTAKCEWWFGPDHPSSRNHDALRKPWAAIVRDWQFEDGTGAAVWLNPPYSQCDQFVGKAAAEARAGATVVVLVPSRTDTAWWHRDVYDAERDCYRPWVASVRWLKGRVKFALPGESAAANGAPFPSVVIVFRPELAVAAAGHPAVEWA